MKLLPSVPAGLNKVKTKFPFKIILSELLWSIVKILSLVFQNQMPAAGAEIFGVFERRRRRPIFFPHFKNKKKKTLKNSKII